MDLRGWLLAAYVALLPVQISLAKDFRLAPADFLILIYVGLRGFRLRWRPRDWTAWHAAALVALAWGALYSQLHGRFDLGTLGVKLGGLILLYVGVLCLLDFMSSVERVRWLLRVFAGWVALHTFVFLIVLLLQNQGRVDLGLNLEGARLSGLLVDPNAFGGLIVTALVLIVLLPRHLALFSRPTTLLIALTLGVGLLFTFSRTGWIGLSFALVAAFLLQPRRLATILLCALPFLVVGAAVVATTASSHVAALATREEVDGGSRATIIEESIDDLMTAPLSGIGLDQAYARHGRIVHNTVVWFLTEMGPLGFVSILGLIGSYAVRALAARRRLPPWQRALPVALLVAHAGMLGVSMGIEALNQRHWWLVMAAITACYAWATATEPEAARGRAAVLRPRAGAGRSRVAPPVPDLLGCAGRAAASAGGSTAPPAPSAPPAPAVVGANGATAPVPLSAGPAPTAATETAPARGPATLAGRARRALRSNLRREAVSHGSWGLIDQATSSGTNFLLSVVVASSVSAEDFGAFSFVSVLYIVAIGVWRALNAEPFMIRYAARPEHLPGAAGRSLGSTWFFGVAAGVLCIVAGEVVATPYRAPMQVLGVALPFLLVQDTARVVGFTMFRARVAAINDAIWGGLMVVALVFLALIGHAIEPWMYLAAWAATGAFAGLLILRQLRIVLDLGVASPDSRETFLLGRPLLANYLLTSAPPYFLFLVTPAIAGLAELGVLRAAFVPFGPLGVLLQGMQLVALPYAVKQAQRSDVVHLARRLSFGLAAVAAAWGVLVSLLLPAGIGSWLIGDLWEPTQATRLLFAVAFVGEGLSVGPLLALRALGAAPRLVRVKLLAGPSTLVLGLAMLPVLGAEGVALAFIVGHILTLAAAVVEVRRLVARPSTADAAASAAVLLPGSPE